MGTKKILIFAFMVCSATARADSISIAPSAPTNATPVTATVSGISSAYLGAAWVYAVVVRNSNISINICFPVPSLGGGGEYQVNALLGTLSPGIYSVSSFTKECDVQYGPNPTEPFIQQATTNFRVTGPVEVIPTLTPLSLIALNLMLGLLGVGGFRWRRMRKASSVHNATGNHRRIEQIIVGVAETCTLTRRSTRTPAGGASSPPQSRVSFIP